jgi:hypothetical protein
MKSFFKLDSVNYKAISFDIFLNFSFVFRIYLEFISSILLFIVKGSYLPN